MRLPIRDAALVENMPGFGAETVVDIELGQARDSGGIGAVEFAGEIATKPANGRGKALVAAPIRNRKIAVLETGVAIAVSRDRIQHVQKGAVGTGDCAEIDARKRLGEVLGKVLLFSGLLAMPSLLRLRAVVVRGRVGKRTLAAGRDQPLGRGPTELRCEAFFRR